MLRRTATLSAVLAGAAIPFTPAVGAKAMAAAPVAFCVAARGVVHTGATPVLAESHCQTFHQERPALRRDMIPAAGVLSTSTPSQPRSAVPESVDRVIEALHDVLG
jgi:hypothetical protein